MNNIAFDAQTHTYTLDGEVIPSVTQILEQAGLVDFSKVDQEVLRRSRDFGTAVHYACELDDKGTLDEEDLDDPLRPFLAGWRKFKEDFHFKIEAVEEVVFSAKLKYAGKLDRRGIINKRRSIVDIKTSDEIYPANPLQLSGYEEAYNEEKATKDKSLDRYIVNLLSDGTYKLMPCKDTRDRLFFLSAVNIAKFRRETGLWKPQSMR